MAKKISKKLLYKIGLPVGSIAVVAAPLAAVVSCDNSSLDQWMFPSHRVVQSVTSNDSGISYLEEHGGFLFYTPLYSSVTQTTEVFAAHASMTLSLFRFVQPDFDQKQFDASGKIIGSSAKREVKKRFEMAKSITIIHTDNSEVKFNSDSDDVNDDQSVNGHKFANEIASGKVKSFKFDLRDDIQNHNWRQQISGKKLSNIGASDLLRGIQLQIMESGKTRSASTKLSLDKIKGIDSDINAAILAIHKGSETIVNTGTAASNRGMFFDTNYGLQGDKILNALDDPVVKKEYVPDEKTFVLPFDTSFDIPGSVISNVWNELFGSSAGIAAVSDKEVQNLITKNDNLLKNSIGDDNYNKIKDTDLYKSGYYHWVLAPKEGQFVAGKYYFSESSTKLWSAKQNDDYIDPRWLNQKNSKGEKTTILEYREKTITTSETSKTAIANEYIAGTNVSASFSNFTANQQTQILSNLEKWGARFSAPFTSRKVSGGASFFSEVPFIDGDGKIYFSNNFAKLLYGKTMHDIQDSKTLEDTIKYQAAGNGLQFRTNFAALVNSTQFLRAINPSGISTYMGWPTPFAPEGVIGKDANNQDVILSDVIKGVTNNGVDEEKVASFNVSNVDANGNITTYPLTFSGYLDQIASPTFDAFGPSKKPDDTLPLKDPNDKNSHYSPFEWIQKNINESINIALGTNYPVGYYSEPSKVPENEKITFEMPYGNGIFQQTRQFVDAYNNFKKLIQSVDPRLNPVAAVDPASEQSTKDVTVLVNDWTTSFNIDAPQNGKTTYYWLNRIMSHGGYGINPFSLSANYSSDTPAAAIFDNMGYLQSGNLFNLSYLSTVNDLGDASKHNVVSKIKPLVDFVKNKFYAAQGTQTNTDGFWSTKFENRFKSSQKSEILDALRSFKFEDLYKSDPELVARYDYIGLKGLEKIQDIQARFDKGEFASQDEDQISQDLDIALNSIALFFNGGASSFKIEVLDKGTTQETLDLMQAWESINYQQFQPYLQRIVDRRTLIIQLNKTWYNPQSQDSAGLVDLSRFRVDLDHEDGNYLKPEIIYGEDGKPNGTVY